MAYDPIDPIWFLKEMILADPDGWTIELKRLFRRATREPRVGISWREHGITRENMRRIEIAMVFWRLHNYPDSSIHIATGRRDIWQSWLGDSRTVLERSSHALRSSLVVDQGRGRVSHMGYEQGCVLPLLFTDTDPPLVTGEHPMLVVSNMRINTDLLKVCCEVFDQLPGALILTTTVPELSPR